MKLGGDQSDASGDGHAAFEGVLISDWRLSGVTPRAEALTEISRQITDFMNIGPIPEIDLLQSRLTIV